MLNVPLYALFIGAIMVLILAGALWLHTRARRRRDRKEQTRRERVMRIVRMLEDARRKDPHK
jgi:hypothetical protein